MCVGESVSGAKAVERTVWSFFWKQKGCLIPQFLFWFHIGKYWNQDLEGIAASPSSFVIHNSPNTVLFSLYSLIGMSMNAIETWMSWEATSCFLIVFKVYLT